MHCVYLTIYHGTKLPPFYIGSSSVKKVKNGYRGSVVSKAYKTLWEDELKNNFNLFSVHIISIHENREDALKKENLIQRKLNVIFNPLYINKAYASGCFGDTSTGRKLSESHKEALLKANKGRKMVYNPGAYERLIASRKGRVPWNKGKKGVQKCSDETRLKMSRAGKGKQKTKEHIEAIKNAKLAKKLLQYDSIDN